MSKIAYGFNDEGYFLGAVKMQRDHLASAASEKEVYLIPSKATDKEPPSIPKGKEARWNGVDWVLVDSREHQKLLKEEQERTKEELNRVKVWLFEDAEGNYYSDAQSGEKPSGAIVEIPEDLIGEDPSVFVVTGKTKKKITIDEVKKSELEQKREQENLKAQARKVELKSAYQDLDGYIDDKVKLKKLLKSLLEETLGADLD